MSHNLFYFKNICLSFADHHLFRNISLQVQPKDKICLVGRNGSGKSTLLKMMANLIEPDKGERHYHSGVSIGFLGQVPQYGEDKTIYQYVLENINLSSEEILEQKTYLADIILDSLKLSGDKLLSKLSGGKLRRADLARTLVSSPELLFLDEPTNHLDIESIEWLESYLKDFTGGLVLISHDRSFLNNISNKTIWIDRGKFLENNRGYKDFERWSEEVLTKEARELEKLGKELDKENLWRQQGVTARRKRNQQRLANLFELREKIKNDKARFNNLNNSLKMDLADSSNRAKQLVQMKNVSFKFTDVKPDKIILKPFSLQIMKGEKIGVMGRNGAGKSTLVKLITGQLKPTEGEIIYGANLETSYLDQARSNLNPEKTLWEMLLPNGGDTIFLKDKSKHVVAYLKDFLFSDSQVKAKISTLSGGEQNRLLLAKLMINPGNFLILDEPTNDLDMDTLDLLLELLSDYQGSLLVVSHDRDFLERLVTRTIIIEENNIHDLIGGYYSFVNNKPKIVKENVNIKEQKTPSIKLSKKLSYKDERELSLLPEKIDHLLKEINSLEEELACKNLYNQNPQKFHQISEKIVNKKKELEEAETRWLELEEEKEKLS